MGKRIDYPFEIRPLSAEVGGGFLILYPDFSDCLSEGKTVEEALTNGIDALKSKIAALKAKELPIPLCRTVVVSPLESSSSAFPRQSMRGWPIAQRLEGVSLNTLVVTFIAKGLGRKERHAGFSNDAPPRQKSRAMAAHLKYIFSYV